MSTVSIAPTPPMTIEELAKLAEKVFVVVRAIKHPLRKQMMAYLRSNGPTKVTDIYRHFKLEQSVCSQHLHILRKPKLVLTNREGKEIFYSVNEEMTSWFQTHGVGMVGAV